MDRRELLKIGLASGATLVIERIGEAPAAASSKTVAFYSTANAQGQGTGVNDPGGPLDGFHALIAVTGKSARGTMVDITSATGNNQWNGYRLRGTVTGKSLTLSLYDLSDLAFASPVGSISATLKKNVYSGPITLNNAPAGTISLKAVPLNAAKGHQVVGKYFLFLSPSDPLSSVGSGEFKVSANNTFTATQVKGPSDTSVPATASGRWGVAYDAKSKTTIAMAVTLLPDLTGVNLNGRAIPSEVHVAKLTIKKGTGVGGPLAPDAGGAHAEPNEIPGLFDFLSECCDCNCFCS